MAYRYIAFDLDGTALHSDRTMSERLKSACQRAAARGCIVAISSGRIYRSTKRFSDFLGIDAPVINCQGAIISDAMTGKELYSRPLEYDMLCDAVDFLRSHNHFVQANTNDGFYFEEDCKWSKYYGSLQGFDGVLVKDLKHDLPCIPAKIVGLAEPEVTLERFEQAKAFFGDRMEIAISQPTMVEFTHPEASKGNALDWICSYYNITPDEMIAVGDSFNDISMIEYAGLGAAVANARQEILDIADVVVSSNDEDGVAELIERYMLEE